MPQRVPNRRRQGEANPFEAAPVRSDAGEASNPFADAPVTDRSARTSEARGTSPEQPADTSNPFAEAPTVEPPETRTVDVDARRTTAGPGPTVEPSFSAQAETGASEDEASFLEGVAGALKSAEDFFQRAAGGAVQALGEGAGLDEGVPSPARPVVEGITGLADFLHAPTKDNIDAERATDMVSGAIDAARGDAGVPDDNAVAELGERIVADATREIARERPDLEQGTPGFYGYVGTRSLIQFGPAAIAASVTRRPRLGVQLLGGQVGAEQYARARQRGKSETQAAEEAVFYGATEAIPEGMVLGRLIQQGGGVLRNVVANGFAEGAQEVVTEGLQTAYEAGVLEEDVTVDDAVRRLVDAGIIGTGVGGTMSVATEPIRRLQQRDVTLGDDRDGPRRGPGPQAQGESGAPLGAEVATGAGRAGGGEASTDQATTGTRPAPEAQPDERTEVMAAAQAQAEQADLDNPFAEAPAADQAVAQPEAPAQQPSETTDTPTQPPEPARDLSEQQLVDRSRERRRLARQTDDANVRNDLLRQAEADEAELEGRQPRLSQAERIRRQRIVRPESDDLLTAVQKLGGLDTDTETDFAGRLRGLEPDRRPGMPALEQPEGRGRTLDDLAEQLADVGFFGERDARRLEERLLEAEGQPVFSDQATTAAVEREAAEQAEAERSGRAEEGEALDVNRMSQAEIEAAAADARTNLPEFTEPDTPQHGAGLEILRRRAARADEAATEAAVETAARNDESDVQLAERLAGVLENAAPRDTAVGGEPLEGVGSFEEFRRQERAGELRSNFGFLDLDNFKALNDSFDHDVGDDVIRAFGRTLIDAVGEGNVFRRSGDEFIVQGNDPGALDAALREAQSRMEQGTLTATAADGSEVRIGLPGFSFGVGQTVSDAEGAQHANKGQRKAEGKRTDRADAGAGDQGRTGQPGRAVGRGDQPAQRTRGSEADDGRDRAAPRAGRQDQSDRNPGQGRGGVGQQEAFGAPSAAQQAQTDVEGVTGRPASDVDRAASQAATSPTTPDPEPTQAQKEAGNYRLGNIRVQGFDIAVENPRGSFRYSLDEDHLRNLAEGGGSVGTEAQAVLDQLRAGEIDAAFRALEQSEHAELQAIAEQGWHVRLPHHYGYFRRTEGNDGDAVDTFVGATTDAETAYVVDQTEPGSATFDEHKVMLGFASEAEARQAFRDSFEGDFAERVMGEVTPVGIDGLRRWLDNGDTSRPFAEQASAFRELADSGARSRTGAQPVAQPSEAPAEPAAADSGAQPATVDPQATAGEWDFVEFEARTTTVRRLDADGNVVEREVVDITRTEPSAATGRPVGRIYWLRHQDTGAIRPFGRDAAATAMQVTPAQLDRLAGARQAADEEGAARASAPQRERSRSDEQAAAQSTEAPAEREGTESGAQAAQRRGRRDEVPGFPDDAATLDAEGVRGQVLDAGRMVTLTGGIAVERVAVDLENRAELKGVPANRIGVLERQGAETERVDGVERVFLPRGREAEVLARILPGNPPQSVAEPVPLGYRRGDDGATGPVLGERAADGARGATDARRGDDRLAAGAGAVSGAAEPGAGQGRFTAAGPVAEVDGQLDLFVPEAQAPEAAAHQPRLLNRVDNVAVGTYRAGLDTIRQDSLLDGASDVAHLMAPLRKQPQEQLNAVVTNRHGGVIGVIRHTIGGTSDVRHYASILLGSIADLPDASQIWFVHQHPSADPEQSIGDREVTAALTDVAEGTGIAVKGMVVVSPGGDHSFFAPDSDASTEAFRQADRDLGKIPARRRDKALPVYERQFRRLHGRQARVDSSEQARAAIAQELGGDDGLLLLDTRGHVAGVMPLSTSAMTRLRHPDAMTPDDAPAGRLLRAIHQANATRIVGQMSGKNAEAAVRNLARFARQLDVQLLDAKDANSPETMAEAGTLPRSDGRPYFSRQALASEPMGPDRGVATDEAQRTADNLLGDMTNAPPVRVVASEVNLPQGAREKIRERGAEGEVRGVWHDGQAYIVAGNVPNAAAVEEAVVHEVIGHFGLRGAVGADLDPILDQVADSNRDAIRAIGDRLGLDLRTTQGRREAAEERLAEMAETGENPSLVQRALAAVRDWLRRMGFNLPLRDFELLALIRRARDFVRRGEVVRHRDSLPAMGGPVPAEPEPTRFSRTAQPMLHGTDSDGRSGGAAAPDRQGRWHVFVKRDAQGQLFDDGPRRFTERTQAAARQRLEAFGLTVSWERPQLEVAQAQPLFTATFDELSPTARSWLGQRTQGWLDRVRQKAQDKHIDLKRIEEAVAEARGITQLPDDVDPYMRESLYHGRAQQRVDTFRDRYVRPLVNAMSDAGVSIEALDEYLMARHARERNARMASINPTLEEGEGSGMTDAEADAVMERLREEGTLETMEQLARRVDQIVEAQRSLLVIEGLERPETVEAWRRTYDRYVPLRGFEEVTEETPTAQPERGGGGFDVRGDEGPRALGRRSRAGSPLSFVVANYESALVRAEKNRVAKSLLRLAEANPNPRLWEVDKVEYEPRFNERTGLVEYRPSQRFQLADNTVVAKVGGVDRYITLHGERGLRIARGFKNLGAAQSNVLVRGLMTVNRYLSAVNTGYNPVFLISNFARDIQTAGINLAGTDADEFKTRIVGDVFKAMRGVRAVEVRGESQGEWASAYERFKAAGAKTGWVDTFADQEQANEFLRNEMRELEHGNRDPRVVLRKVMDRVQAENTAVENAIRLSAYKNALERGFSEDRAAALAKELTVNFNRKGEWGPVLNGLYLFYNAGLQGSVRTLQAMKSKKVRGIAYATVAGATILALANRLLGGEDDDGIDHYDKIPDWVKARNLIFMLPGTDGEYVSLPLPYGYNVLHVIGQEAGDAMAAAMGWKRRWDGLDSVTTIGAAFLDAFNPIGGEATWLQTAAPTVLDPFVQIEQNADWAGRPVYPTTNPYERAPEPQAHRHWSTTAEWSKWTAQSLNALSGGTEITPGAIDVHPDTLERFFEFGTGGAGRFLSESVDAPFKAITGEPLRPHQVPFLGKVYGDPGRQATQSDFYDLLTRIEYARKEVEQAGRRRGGRSVTQVRQEYRDRLRLVGPAGAADRRVRDIRDQIEQVRESRLSTAQKRERIDRLRDRMEQVMLDFTRRYYAATAD